MHVWCAYCCGVAYCLGTVFVGAAGGVVGAVDLVGLSVLVCYAAWGVGEFVWLTMEKGEAYG